MYFCSVVQTKTPGKDRLGDGAKKMMKNYGARHENWKKQDKIQMKAPKSLPLSLGVLTGNSEDYR